MILVVCDRCRGELDTKDEKVRRLSVYHGGHADKRFGTWEPSTDSYRMDLCPKCVDAFDKWANPMRVEAA